MTKTLSRDELERALSAAAAAHHDYELNVLNGIRDVQWSGFYAAYTLGRLGDFTNPTSLTRWLESVPGEANWAGSAAVYVLAQLGG